MNDIETKLKQLLPNAGTLDRDALLYSAAFAAGQAAGRKPWMRLSAVLALAAAVLAFSTLLSNRLPPLPSQAIAPAEPPTAVAPVRPDLYQLEPTSYIALMQHLGEYSPPASGGATAEPRAPLTPRSRFEY